MERDNQGRPQWATKREGQGEAYCCYSRGHTTQLPDPLRLPTHTPVSPSHQSLASATSASFRPAPMLNFPPLISFICDLLKSYFPCRGWEACARGCYCLSTPPPVSTPPSPSPPSPPPPHPLVHRPGAPRNARTDNRLAYIRQDC